MVISSSVKLVSNVGAHVATGSYEVFGESEIVIRRVPILLAEKDFIPPLLELATTSKQSLPIAATLKVLACKSAVKATKPLNKQETNGLLKLISQMDEPYTCPHRRPTIMVINKTEVERSLMRRK